MLRRLPGRDRRHRPEGDHLDLAVGADIPAGERLRRISRPHSSSPAVGSAKRHQAEQEQLVREVFEA
ncbi:hypothetical protein [Streptomyces sp. NPDC052127]|uniref:hypothetical protein n=1 Tax=Streptomyces sp. NPDC052127 TaxID=3155679 RepID=UPI00341B8780